MSNQETEDLQNLQILQQQIIENYERKAMDISQRLDLLAEEVRLGKRSIRAALSTAFHEGLRT